MPPFAPMQLSGFNRVPVETCFVARAERLDDVSELVKQREHRVLARGAGRGYGDNALNRDEGVIFTQRLDRILAFDDQAGTVHCEGGCTLGRIIETFLPRGWFPLVTPGTKLVTVGGCIAGDVHGKNHHRDGSFASSLIDFELLLPSGQLLPCSRDQNADVFLATLGGMGLTGIILSARLRLRRVESAFLAVEYEQIPNLDAALARFAETDQHSTYSVAWIDCLASGESMGRSVLMRGEHAPAADVPPRHRDRPLIVSPRRSRSVPFMMPSFVLNSWTVKAFNRRFYRQHTAGRRVVDYDTFFYPLDSVLNYDRMYGRRGFVQYQAVLPRESSRAALGAMLRKLGDSRSASFLAVLKTMGEPSGGVLSFPRGGHTLALDLPNTGDRLRNVIEELDRIVLDHDGRIYLAKDSFATPEAVRRMYPRLDEFRAIKQRLDPQGRLTSSLARRVGLA